MPLVLERIDNVRKFRLSSISKPTQKLASTPTKFHVENIPNDNYLLIPKVSSERRSYIPMGLIGPNILCSDLVFVVPNATLYNFGVLTSQMHMTWVRYICGRLKSDYRYSKDIVYNNFPWPESISKEFQEKIETAAQTVLDVRAEFPNSSLADLYDPRTMPPILQKAHQALDRSVDQAYGFPPKGIADTPETRIAFLFDLYKKYTEK